MAFGNVESGADRYGRPPRPSYGRPPVSPGAPPPAEQPPPVETYTGQDWSNLSAILTPAEMNEYAQLNVAFRSFFLGGQEDFNYQKYLTDSQYAQVIEHQKGRDPFRAPEKAAALQAMLDFFDRVSKRQQTEESKLDPSKYYGPLKEEIARLAAQTTQAGTADISRGYAGARERAQEGLAGTGLGRSGAAAGMFAGLEGQRQGAVDRLLARIQNYELQANFQVEQKIAEMRAYEDARARGLTEQQAQEAVNFQRQLFLQNFQALQQNAANQKEWWETWMPVLSAAASFIPGVGPVLGPALAVGSAAASGYQQGQQDTGQPYYDQPIYA